MIEEKNLISEIISTMNNIIEEITELKRRTAFLEALEEAGVDNWGGYPAAVKIYEEKMKDVEC